RNEWKDESSACPVANPVITCASVSNAGFPSNFVDEPFLFLKDQAENQFCQVGFQKMHS
ncbi:hypothetical protein MKX03_003716, partial [Papaver bracteatum]